MSLLTRRALKQDKGGVASTVGTIMALLVILAFFSIFINQYVPVWSKEAEAAHMSTVLGHFGALKSSIDEQILAAQVAITSETTYIPTETYSPVQLGSEGIPVFSSPTVGRIDGRGEEAPWTIRFDYNIEGNRYSVSQSSAGNIVLTVANRYHVPFTMSYEGGSIIVSQTVGEAIRVQPLLAILNGTNGVEIGLVLIQLIGSGNVAGSGIEGVRSKLLALDMQTFTSMQGPLWINHTTRFGVAWFNYLNTTLSLAFGVLDSDFGNPGYDYFESPTGRTAETPYYVLSRSESNQTHTVSLQMANGSPGSPIAKLTLHHAFVSIAIGRSSSTLEV